MMKDYVEFKEASSTFRNASRGGENNQPMIDSNAKVYYFDKIAKIYAKKNKLKFVPSTNDALFVDNDTNKFYFIEFKSGTIDKLKLLYKVYDSAIILFDFNLFDSFGELHKNTEFILVYNHSKIFDNKFKSDNREKLSNKIRNRAKNAKQLFNTKHLKNMLYSNVYTLTVNEFISEFGKTFDIVHT